MAETTIGCQIPLFLEDIAGDNGHTILLFSLFSGKDCFQLPVSPAL
jgi:hypothetical protein